MGFINGSVSFRQFDVVGGPSVPSVDIITKLATHTFKKSELGTSEDVEYGWVGGRHIYDTEFNFENNVYGEYLVFGLRIDTNTVPGSVKRAYRAIEEEALAKDNPSGFLSKIQKREARDTTNKRCEEERNAGKYRKTKMINIVWDFTKGKIYSPMSGKSYERFSEIFERTFGFGVRSLTAGVMAGGSEDPTISDLAPTAFVIGPAGPGMPPTYPWAAKGDDMHKWLGNEFLTWLIYHCQDGPVKTLQTEGMAKDATIFIDGSINLDCSYEETGRDVIKGVGPVSTPEFKEAVRLGKVPRKAGMLLDFASGSFSLNLQCEQFAIGGLKLPKMEDAESPRVHLEERLNMVRDVSGVMGDLYITFLSERTNKEKWASTTVEIGNWMKGVSSDESDSNEEE